MKRLLVLCALACLRLGAEPPVKMAAYHVSEAMLSIQVTTRWAQSSQSYVGQWVDSMRVGGVQPHSIAEKAGLRRGMEILAIQGQLVHGLTQDDLNHVLLQEVTREVVLQVRSSAHAAPVEIHLPVGQ
jgi:predicted metalloprotease with PDZ domain